MNFQEARVNMENGECVRLPGWFGFWFIDGRTDSILVLTKENKISHTPHLDLYSDREDWQLCEPSIEQQIILNDLFKKEPYKPLEYFDFGFAIKMMKEGFPVSRSGWNGKELFVFMQISAVIDKEVVPKMQLLPDSVKNIFLNRFRDDSAQIDAIYYSNQMAIVDISNSIKGWSPSVSDSLAEDWFVFHP